VATTLILIAISHRWLSSNAIAAAGTSPGEASSTRPEWSLLGPFIAFTATALITATASAGFESLYPLGVLITGAVLWRYRAAYRNLFGTWIWGPLAVGVLVFLIWLSLVPGSTREGTILAHHLNELPNRLALIWICFRVVGSVIIVPFAEELAFRGYLIRKLVSANFEQVRPGQFSWLSFIVSSLLFGLLHQNFAAGFLAGVAFALALYRRGLVGDSILAHMTSNFLIAVAVLVAGLWGLWA
jgi:CAAX prenyl protease-like protein